jgi:hypothetical protein
MTDRPSSQDLPSGKFVTQQPLPHIEPEEGLPGPLLLDAMQHLSTPSVAEYVLSIHHEYNKARVKGLPLGTNEQEVFNFYWDKVEELSHSAVLLPLHHNLVPKSMADDDFEVEHPDGWAVLATLHSDKSALLWVKTSGEDYAPVPQPFYLDMRRSDFLGVYPTDIFPLGGMDKDVDLASFLTGIWHDPSVADDLPLEGEISLRAALQTEARQWIDWLPTALPVPCTYEKPGVAECEIIYPWLYDLYLITDEQKQFLKGFSEDFIKAMAIQEGLTIPRDSSAITGGLSIMGRVMTRQGQIANPTIFIGWGDVMGDDVTTTGAWEKCLQDIMAQPSFPIPEIAQVRMNTQMRGVQKDKGMELYGSSSLYWDTVTLTEDITGHEAMEIISKVSAYGVKLPSKGSAFKKM